jgi:peptidyl-prolyl cis-trans isomerase B (cyclophilin B)
MITSASEERADGGRHERRLQCGDPTGTGTGGPGFEFGPVENAPRDGFFPAGTVGMARAASPDSHGSQFLIAYRDSTIAQGDPNGYTVLGRVTGGVAVIEDIAGQGTVDGGDDGSPRRGLVLSAAMAAPA